MTSSLESSLAHAPQGFQPVHAAHADVHDDEVRPDARDQFQAFLAAGSRGQLDFRRIKYPLERVSHVLFVVN